VEKPAILTKKLVQKTTENGLLVFEYRGSEYSRELQEGAYKYMNLTDNVQVTVNRRPRELTAVMIEENIPNFNEDPFADINDPYHLKRDLYKEEIKIRQKLVKEMEKQYLALYYVLWSNMTLESRSKVLQLTEFNESERDVFRLWQAIINTHQNTGYDGVFNKFHARDNYRRIYMGKDELLDRFKQRYDDALNLLRSAKQSVPPEDEQAMDFIYKLDNKKFIRFRTELHNQVINRIAEFPTTLSDAYYRAGQWKEVAYNTGSGGGGEHL
jgi:hypothetical protein